MKLDCPREDFAKAEEEYFAKLDNPRQPHNPNLPECVPGTPDYYNPSDKKNRWMDFIPNGRY